MQVRVELELRLDLPDDDADQIDLRQAVAAYLFHYRNKRAAELLAGVKIIDVTPVEGWGWGGHWEGDIFPPT